MKMIFKVATVVLVIACILLTVGCKKKKAQYQGPVDLPSDSIINSDGEVVEDEITVDDLLGIESDKTDTTSKDESDTTSNNSSTNKDESSKNETSSDKNDTENSKPDDNKEEENSSNTSSGNSSSNKNDDVVSGKEENNGFKDDLGWF